MPLPSGTKLGPYEIISALGSGGMGEVYRARDTRLHRDVAIKVMPASLAQDPDRLRRFEQEARAVAALNHPGILSVYDVGSVNGAPYLVSELLEGETLRGRMQGTKFTIRKIIEYAVQCANGLAAAHEQGIVHRDLKPENVFITRDDRLKILDFGLAKLHKPHAIAAAETAVGTATVPGQVLGTVGYMSPEQVRGEAADRRSDIFSLGAILYEMLAGQRPFRGATGVETLNAILKEEPPDVVELNRSVPPGLERIVRHCLEKDARRRFQSARDLAFDLEAISAISAPVSATPTVGKRGRLLAWWMPIAAVLLVVLAVLASRSVWPRPQRELVFHRISFRRGTISQARFAPDGDTIIYGAAFDGKPSEIDVARVGSTESRALGIAGTDFLGISSTGEMAVSLNRHGVTAFVNSGTLARAPLAGGTPRELLNEVEAADWSPDGGSLAIVRQVNGKEQLEYPIGTVLYQTAGWISHPRVSPHGNSVAFIEHPIVGDDGGSIAVVDTAGHAQTLASGFVSADGIAWSPDQKEVWFTATHLGVARALQAVSTQGVLRTILSVPGTLTVQDVSRSGRVLVTRDEQRAGIMALAPGDTKERELGWHDWSVPRDLSNDGKTVLFMEAGEAGGDRYATYIRQTDGSPAIRLGDGAAQSLSPDGKLALAVEYYSSPVVIDLLPTGAGEARQLRPEGVRIQAGWFFPTGKTLLLVGSETGHGSRLYAQDLKGGKPRPITPEGVRTIANTIAPDGNQVAAINPEQGISIYSLSGGEPKPLPGALPGDTPLRWGVDGSTVFLTRQSEFPHKIYRVTLATGKREVWKTLLPADLTGLMQGTTSIRITSDGKYYVYSYARQLSDLYVIDGLK